MPTPNIVNLINKLLFSQDCVVIPDFGGFIANYLPADFEETAKIFSPPKRRLAFNEVLKFDDKLLASFIAQSEGITREESSKSIQGFVKELREQLQLNRHFSFGEIGTFKLNAEDKLQFESNTQLNLFAEGYGLSQLTFLPLNQTLDLPVEEITTVQNSGLEQPSNVVFVETPVQKSSFQNRETVENERKYEFRPRKKSSFSINASIFALTVLLGGVVYLAFYNSKNSTATQKSSLNPIEPYFEKNNPPILQPSKTIIADTSIITTKTTQIPPPKTVLTPIIQENLVPENIEDTKSIKKYRYHIVAGAFATQKTANILKNQFKSIGFENAILVFPRLKSEKYIKVVAASFDNERDAYRNKDLISKQLKQSVWVFKAY